MSRRVPRRMAGPAAVASLAALLLVVLGTTVVVGGSATSQGMTLKVTSTSVLAHGAGVAIGVDMTCDPINGNSALETTYQGSVSVTQVSSRTVVAVQGPLVSDFNAPVTCDGTVNHFATTLALPAGSAPFKVGSALVDVALAAFDPSNYFGPSDRADTGQSTVRLTK